jgi:transposase
MKYIGIDVSKDKLDIAYLDNSSEEQVTQIKNTISSIKTFLNYISSVFSLPLQVVLEATGVYHLNLVYLLEEHNIDVTILNPLSLKGFSTSYLLTTKTDAVDASLLLRLAQERKPVATKIPKAEWQQKKQLLTEWEHTQKQFQREKNRLHAFSSWTQSSPIAIQLVEERIELLEKQLLQIEEMLTSLSNFMGDEEFEKQVELASTIKGIGKKTAMFVLMVSHSLEYFNSPKELAKFLGLTPTIHQSGRFKKKGRISKKGNPYIRGLLYCCARSAKRFNPQCKELYEKLRKKGKPYKVAMIAVAHKLVRQLFAVVKNQTPYQPQMLKTK